MRFTLENVAQLAKDYEPVQQDGIPDGFLWKKPDVTIGDKEIKGDYVLYVPMTENTLNAQTIEPLLAEYNKNGKRG